MLSLLVALILIAVVVRSLSAVMPKKKQVVDVAEKEKREQNSALRSYLKDCGVRAINAGTEIKLNPKFFPALSYSKPRDCFVIYFQSPHRFGEQSFFFDQVSSFCDRADQNATDLASSSLCFYSSPEDLDNAPAQVQRDFCLAVIKRFFSATTPTVLNAAKRQNKKCRRRLLLKPKLATIKIALGCSRNTAGATIATNSGIGEEDSCCVDIGNVNGTAGGAANNENGTTTNNGIVISSPAPRRSQLQLPDFAEPFIQKAAQEFNLNWFNAFWEQYVAQKGRKAVKRREREKLEELFKDRVSRLQEAKEGV